MTGRASCGLWTLLSHPSPCLTFIPLCQPSR